MIISTFKLIFRDKNLVSSVSIIESLNIMRTFI